MPPVVIAAAVVAGATIYSAHQSSKAAHQASERIAASTDKASQTQWEMFKQNKADMSPWLESGKRGLEKVENLLATGFQPGEYEESPGYQFAVSEGEKASKRRLAAQGLLGSGAALEEASRQGVGVAKQDYWNWHKNMLIEWIKTRLNPYQSLARVGLTTAKDIGTFGSNVATNVARNTIAGGTAFAQGRIAGANAMNKGIQGAVNVFGTAIGGGGGFDSSKVQIPYDPGARRV